MSALELKRWMEVNDKTVVDIASVLKISPDTVRNFLKGKSVHRSTRAALERIVHEASSFVPGARIASGKKYAG